MKIKWQNFDIKNKITDSDFINKININKFNNIILTLWCKKLKVKIKTKYSSWK